MLTSNLSTCSLACRRAFEGDAMKLFGRRASERMKSPSSGTMALPSSPPRAPTDTPEKFGFHQPMVGCKHANTFLWFPGE